MVKDDDQKEMEQSQAAAISRIESQLEQTLGIFQKYRSKMETFRDDVISPIEMERFAITPAPEKMADKICSDKEDENEKQETEKPDEIEQLKIKLEKMNESVIQTQKQLNEQIELIKENHKKAWEERGEGQGYLTKQQVHEEIKTIIDKKLSGINTEDEIYAKVDERLEKLNVELYDKLNTLESNNKEELQKSKQLLEEIKSVAQSVSLSQQKLDMKESQQDQNGKDQDENEEVKVEDEEKRDGPDEKADDEDKAAMDDVEKA